MPDRARLRREALAAFHDYLVERDTHARRWKLPPDERMAVVETYRLSLARLMTALRAWGLGWLDSRETGRRVCLTDYLDDVVIDWLPGNGPNLGKAFPVLDPRVDRASVVTQHRKGVGDAPGVLREGG